ncbi:FAD binding domain-containing protein [Exophiala viscosa]|uniref:FAD binding domain-containing protein n=1 Tax=Exophiala viscosa TaxID=2486360 RepID=UPI00219443CD|nr:FAD binding domain-containing protein [Exophiala viscosa]
MLTERNLETTRWPKMDVTNARSMELLRTMGLADELKENGVPGNFSFDVIFSTGLGEGGEKLATWDLPSPDWWRERISRLNDGSMPREPYLRCSQVIFEAWLKPICEKNPLITTFFGRKFEELTEEKDGVTSVLTEIKTNEKIRVRSQYVIACDGAGSRVRRSAGLKITGGPVPIAMYLVHFRSRDLSRLQSQGQFWHIFMTGGGAIISQDEDEIWTVHLPISLEQDTDKIDPYELVYQFLGSHTGPYPINIDEILVKSVWRPNLVVADEYRSVKGRVFLAGDSAHQNIPTGGYGMNMGLGDAYDIGWKLAAVIKGYGGPHLLESYGNERRPVALRNVERSGQHQSVHWEYCTWTKNAGEEVILSQNEAGKQLKQRIRDYVYEHDGENKDHGIEMGYRHRTSPVIFRNDGESEPEWTVRSYIPSTWPGSRAPHVFLNDGSTSIFDLFGDDYTIVDFTPSGEASKNFGKAAEKLNIPLKQLHLPREDHSAAIWERKVVLVRPDQFVAWRSREDLSSPLDDYQIDNILQIAVGKRPAPHSAALNGAIETSAQSAHGGAGLNPFSATVGNVEQDAGKIEKMAAFQSEV